MPASSRNPVQPETDPMDQMLVRLPRSLKDRIWAVALQEKRRPNAQAVLFLEQGVRRAEQESSRQAEAA